MKTLKLTSSFMQNVEDTSGSFDFRIKFPNLKRNKM